MSSDAAANRRLATLYEEHLRLGATFADDGVVARYVGEHEARQVAEGAFLCDISDMSLLLFSGEPATSFAQTAFAGKRLAQLECAFEAVLVGDGSLASVPLLMRTGTNEYLVADISKRSEVLEAWLSFLSSINQDGRAPFEGLDKSDVCGTHVVLTLAGAKATSVLSDYLKDPKAALPKLGRVTQCLLDAIPCIIACMSVGGSPLYVILVPPVHAVALWRSLLSFVEVAPCGRAEFCRYLSNSLPWFSHLRSGDTIRLDETLLARDGLLRSDRDFVGARGLSHESNKEGSTS